MNPSEALASLLLSVGGFLGVVVAAWSAFEGDLEMLIAGGVMAVVGIVGLLLVGHRTWAREHPELYAPATAWTGTGPETSTAVIIPPTDVTLPGQKPGQQRER